MTERQLRYLPDEQIRSCLDMKKAIELMKEAFIQISARTVTIPVRTGISTSDGKGRTLFMPSYSPQLSAFGVKVVSVFPENDKKGLPVIQGKLLVLDGQTGTPTAMLDAEYLTALRTGAASGLASDCLAIKDSQVLGIIGAGTQSYFQVLGVLEVRPIKKIMLFGRSEKNLHELKNKLKTIFGGEIRLPERKTELQVADIICTATTSDHPVVERSHINDHVHINGIGSFKPSMNEISAEVIKASTLVVDHRESALSEAGDILKAIAQNAIEQHHIHAELGEILSGNKVGRESNDQITIFKSVGNAIQDLVMADYIVKSLV